MNAEMKNLCADLAVSEAVQGKLTSAGVVNTMVLANQFKSLDSLDGFIQHIANDLPDELFGCEVDASPLAAKIRGLYNRALKLENKETAPEVIPQPGRDMALGAPVAASDSGKRAAKVDQAKRREMEAAFDVAYPGSFLGSDRSAPGNKLLARCLDMASGGKDWPGKYIDPSLCSSITVEEEEGKKTKAFWEDEDDDSPRKGEFVGGPHRLEFLLSIRNKAGRFNEMGLICICYNLTLHASLCVPVCTRQWQWQTSLT